MCYLESPLKLFSNAVAVSGVKQAQVHLYYLPLLLLENTVRECTAGVNFRMIICWNSNGRVMPSWRAILMKSLCSPWISAARIHLLCLFPYLQWRWLWRKGEKNGEVADFLIASIVIGKGIANGVLCSVLTKTPQLVLLFRLRSRSVAYMSTGPSHRLPEAKVVSLATAFERQGGNSPVSSTWSPPSGDQLLSFVSSFIFKTF